MLLFTIFSATPTRRLFSRMMVACMRLYMRSCLISVAFQFVSDMPYSCKQFSWPNGWSDDQRIKSPNDFFPAYCVWQILECFNTFFYRRYIRLKAFLCIVIQCHLEVIMNAHFIQYMKIGHYWFWVLCPKHNNSTLTERDIHLLLIERIVPSTIAFCQAVEKPLGIKGWYICWTTDRNNDRCYCLNYLLTTTIKESYSDKRMIHLKSLLWSGTIL